MLPTKKQNNKAPYFVWTRKVPDVFKLRVYGYLVYAHLDGKKLPKLSPRAVPCVYWVMHQMEKDTSCSLGPHLVT